MKDLFKGHHPWLLVFMLIAFFIMALGIRFKIIADGHYASLANTLSIIFFIGITAVYAIFYEFLKTDLPLFLKALFRIKKKDYEAGNTPIYETEALSEVPPNKSDDVRTDEVQASTVNTSESISFTKEEMLGIIASLAERPTSPEPEIHNSIQEAAPAKPESIIDLSEIGTVAQRRVDSEADKIYTKACEYTVRVLGEHLPKEGLVLVLERLRMFQMTATKEWEVPTDRNGRMIRANPNHPVCRTSLFHYGWNMGKHLEKSGPQIAYFLRTTFHEHFDKLELSTIRKKLTNDPNKGVIKLEWMFCANYRERERQEIEREERAMQKAEREAKKQRKFEAGQERRKKAEEAYERNKNRKNHQPHANKPSRGNRNFSERDMEEAAYAAASGNCDIEAYYPGQDLSA